MRESVATVSIALETFDKETLGDSQVKASEEVLVPLVGAFFKNLGLQNSLHKRSLHELIRFVPDHEIDPEITQKLDAIAIVAETAAAA